MINPMTCLNRVKGSGEDEKFVGGSLTYMDNKIKGNNHKNIKLNK